MSQVSYDDFDAYQNRAATTAIYPNKGEFDGLAYAALGLNGEAGELAEGVKKALRDDEGEVTPDRRNKLAAELGDVLWYCAQLATELGIQLGDVAAQNLFKLQSRQERGVLRGSGDER